MPAPLRAIANLSQWIEEDISDTLNEDSRHHMHLLHGRVHRLEALIDGLLQYSRVRRIKIEAEPVDVADLLVEVINAIAPPLTFRWKTLASASPLSRKLWKVTGDASV